MCAFEPHDLQNTDFGVVKTVDTTPKIVSDESDVFPVEEKEEVKLDILPWFSMPNDTSEAWVPPHHCNTECWHQDPVDVAARRHELAGHFKEASNLRIGFRGLSILHRRVLRWYGWARKQRALNGESCFAFYSYHTDISCQL